MLPLTLAFLLVAAIVVACGDDHEEEPTPTTGVTCPDGAQAGAEKVAAALSGNDDVNDVSKIDCLPAFPADPIRTGSVIETDDLGDIKFKLDNEELWCQMLANTRLKLLPDDDYLIEWLQPSGVTWCGKSPVARDHRYKPSSNVEIRAAEPIFAVSRSVQGTLVQVADGAITVIVDADREFEVEAGEQIFISESGEIRPGVLETNDDDEAAIAWLRSVLPPPPPTTKPASELPDLVVSRLNATFILTEESCQVDYVLENRGLANAGRSTTRITVNGISSDQDVPELKEGDRVEMQAIVEGADCSDDYELDVEVDSENAVTESDETNNLKSLSLPKPLTPTPSPTIVVF